MPQGESTPQSSSFTNPIFSARVKPMKRSILLTLVFFVIFSSPSYADWTEVNETVDGSTVYVDFERIRKQDGYVYWWQLNNYKKISIHGHLSAGANFQGECKQYSFKVLSFSFHKEPMLGGAGKFQEPAKKGWRESPPASVMEQTLKAVCSR
jgi:hypothetical protein